MTRRHGPSHARNGSTSALLRPARAMLGTERECPPIVLTTTQTITHAETCATSGASTTRAHTTTKSTIPQRQYTCEDSNFSLYNKSSLYKISRPRPRPPPRAPLPPSPRRLLTGGRRARPWTRLRRRGDRPRWRCRRVRQGQRACQNRHKNSCRSYAPLCNG